MKVNHFDTVPDSMQADYLIRENARAKRIAKQLIEMTPAQFAEWRESYYLNLMISPFGIDVDGYDLAPFGWSVEGVPKLLPEDL